MHQIKIFISSVQSEFAIERQMLYSYILSDALLGKFFVPFIFEKLPATDYTPQVAYIKEVEKCDIYIGLIGKHYGRIADNGFSATESEYNHATKKFKLNLISHFRQILCWLSRCICAAQLKEWAQERSIWPIGVRKWVCLCLYLFRKKISG